MKHIMSVSLILAVLACIAVLPVFAQSTAEIAGVITDSSGAVVPGARITVVNEETGLKMEATSGESGSYTIPFLRPGSYRLEVQKEGFRTVSRAGIRIQVAQGVKMDVQLEVGVVSQTLKVSESTPLLDTLGNVVGGVVTGDKLANLPINGRNANAFMFLTPGVRVQRVALSQPVLESHWQFFSINGSRPSQNQFLLDGGNNNDVGFNGPEYSASVDAIQEFRVQTNNFSAEYGNAAGGVINTVTKAGTNDLHGSLYEYFRNDALAGTNYFAKLSHQKKPMLRQNQFGGTVGGPILKNKTFFFVSYEGLRLRLPAGGAATASNLVNIVSVPTDLQKAGDFSQTFSSTNKQIIIYDPTSTIKDPSNPSKYIRTPYYKNAIPPSKINTVAAAVAKYYPPGNSAGDPYTGLNNLFFPGAQAQTDDDVSFRVDHQINDSTSIMGRYSEAFVNIRAPQIFPNISDPYNSNTDQKHFSSVIKVYKTFSSKAFGEFLVSFARLYHFRTQISTNNFDPTTLGFPKYLAANSKVLGFPQFNIDSLSRLGGYTYEPHGYNRPNAAANLTYMTGPHNFKFGVSFNAAQLNGIGFHTAAGVYNFTKAFTQGPDPFQSGPESGFALASFLLGYPATATHSPNIGDAATTAKNLGLYFQDDYKVTPKLTLNLGFRWDYEAPRTERFNRLTNWDFTGTTTLSNGTKIRGGLMFPTVGGLSRGQWNSQKTNFQPRFGFAYSRTADTVIRGGIGIFYGNSWGGAMNYNQIANVGFGCSTSMLTTIDGGLTPAGTLSDPFPTGFCTPSGSSRGLLTVLGESVAAVNRNHQVPKSITWSFDIQHKLPKDVLFEITYSGNRGLNLIGFRELDQLDPQYMSLGTKLNDPVTNPFYGVITTGSLSAATITRGQSLRPYPQFLGVTSPVDTYGASTYHAMYVKVERRFANGFTILGSYTFSKIIDDVIGGQTGFAGGTMARGDLQNFYNNHLERAVASFNTPQTLVISYVYEFPFGPGKALLNRAGPVGKLAGGWQINGSSLFQSGEPLQITGGNSSGTLSGLQRPNWNGKNATLSGDVAARLGRYFDISAFSINDPFTFGSAPRIMPNLYGPGTMNFDMSLFKNTKITERLNLQFRAEAFNVFNRVQFGNPATNINLNTFGRISTQVNLPRCFQLALKLQF